MGDFSASPKWTLVNDFTIHEDELLHSGRPLMRTCVPKTIDIKVTAFEVIRFVEWPSDCGAAKPDIYADRSYIRFSGDLHDEIAVFNMESGEVASFRTVTDATIRPLAPGAIGGKNKSTVYDGIGLSGMSSRTVPENGLMEGEPGSFTFLSEYEEPSGEKRPEELTACLFLDEDKFSRLISAVSFNPRPLKTVRIRVLAELFESEVSASLSEPWMSHNYGLLLKGSDLARTNARIDSIAVSTGKVKLDVDEVDEDAKVVNQVFAVDGREKVDGKVPDHGKVLVRYQRYVILALIVLILVTLFSR